MQRLYLRTLLLIGGLFLIITTTMVIFVYISGSRQIEVEGLNRADTLNRLAFEALYASMREGGGREGNLEVIARLQQVGAFRELRVIKGPPVIRQFGALPDELPRDGVERRALQGEVVREIRWEGDYRVIRYVTPLYVQPECQQCHQARVGEINGAIATEISLAQYDRALQWRRNVLLAVIASGLLTLGVLTFYGLRLTVLRPLHVIQQGVMALSRGDLNYRLELRTGDAFETVATEFNRMADRLHRMYTQLQDAQAKVAAAIEASRNPIWVSDAHRRIVMVNEALERMTGRSREELIGQTCRYLFGVRLHDGRSICDVTCPFLRSDRPDGRVAGCMPTAGGKEAWVEITYGYVQDKDGNINGVVHIVHDLSEHKEVEQLKDEFLSLVSHELRTPLHHIKGFASTLLQPDVRWDAETQRDFLESINHEADRLADLVDKILHFSRLRSNVMPMEKTWWSVHDIVEAALQHHRRVYRRDVHLDVPENLPPIFVDGREIEIVLRNLLENAARYSPPDTPITLGIRHEAGRLHVWVADQGPGIPPEDRERIFEHFYRGHRDRRHTPGTGLGLAICKRIVEAHNGTIWVESASPRGACFHFTLPLVHPPLGPTPADGSCAPDTGVLGAQHANTPPPDTSPS